MGIDMMKSLFLKIPQYFYGKVKYQNIFQAIQYFSYRGMNYNNTINLETTGEKSVVERVLNLIKADNLVILDAGAHHGEYTDLILKKNNGKKNINLHLFEPQYSCHKILKKKYQKESSIKINHVALGSKNEKQIDLFTCSQVSLFATVFQFDIKDYLPHIDMDGIEKVDMVNLYTYCQENNIDSIDFIKLDIEGLEYDCLLSLLPLINLGKIKYIQFEYSYVNLICRNSFHDFWKLLSSQYSINRIAVDGIVPIDNYHLSLENPAPINFLAILK